MSYWQDLNDNPFVIRYSWHFIPGFVIPGFINRKAAVPMFTFAS